MESKSPKLRASSPPPKASTIRLQLFWYWYLHIYYLRNVSRQKGRSFTRTPAPFLPSHSSLTISLQRQTLLNHTQSFPPRDDQTHQRAIKPASLIVLIGCEIFHTKSLTSTAAPQSRQISQICPSSRLSLLTRFGLSHSPLLPTQLGCSRRKCGGIHLPVTSN